MSCLFPKVLLVWQAFDRWCFSKPPVINKVPLPPRPEIGSAVGRSVHSESRFTNVCVKRFENKVIFFSRGRQKALTEAIWGCGSRRDGLRRSQPERGLGRETRSYFTWKSVWLGGNYIYGLFLSLSAKSSPLGSQAIVRLRHRETKTWSKCLCRATEMRHRWQGGARLFKAGAA